MYALSGRNVNVVFPAAMRLMQMLGRERPSRVGRVLELPGPVVTTYYRPAERVLFSHARDANPFFHFFEALWMLAGRNDVDFLRQLVHRMLTFSDDGATLHGAYGNRWRFHFGMNQLEVVASLLRRELDTRRAVLTMWDPAVDLGRDSRDLPCNTTVYFKVRESALHMTVCNRSNDLLWGAYGANVVHLSMLHEYMACRAGGYPLGEYTHFSDSMHVYLDGAGGELWGRVSGEADQLPQDLYEGAGVRPFPMGVGEGWDADLMDFFERWDRCGDPLGTFRTSWWRDVAVPLWRAWRERSWRAAEQCVAADWRHAALQWLGRRPAP